MKKKKNLNKLSKETVVNLLDSFHDIANLPRKHLEEYYFLIERLLEIKRNEINLK